LRVGRSVNEKLKVRRSESEEVRKLEGEKVTTVESEKVRTRSPSPGSVTAGEGVRCYAVAGSSLVKSGGTVTGESLHLS